MKTHCFFSRWSALALAAITAVLSAQANEHDKDKPHSDASFSRHALAGNEAEVKMGELAQQKGQNPEVKRFGQQLVADHGKARQQLQPIADRLGATAAADHGQAKEKHQKKIDKLQNASGAEFDKEFAKCMAVGHKKTVAKYEKASQHAKDAELKSYVNQTLPTLQQHLQAAQSLARAVGVDDAALAAAERESEMDAVGRPENTTESGTRRVDEVIKDKDLRKNDNRDNAP